MALRTLPFRQYNETDVINMFAMGTGFINESVTSSDNGDAGVFVTVESGNLNLDTIVYDSAYDSYLGKTNYPHVGVNQYPRVSLSLKPATSGDALLGITLRQTAKTDENGVKQFLLLAVVYSPLLLLLSLAPFQQLVLVSNFLAALAVKLLVALTAIPRKSARFWLLARAQLLFQPQIFQIL